MALLSLDYTVINLIRCTECSEEKAWVKVKEHLTRRDKNAIKGAVIEMRVDINAETNEVQMPSGIGIDTARALNALDFAILERGIVGWSFEEPVTLANIERLHDADIEQLKEQLGAMYEAKDDETKNSNG